MIRAVRRTVGPDLNPTDIAVLPTAASRRLRLCCRNDQQIAATSKTLVGQRTTVPPAEPRLLALVATTKLHILNALRMGALIEANHQCFKVVEQAA